MSDDEEQPTQQIPPPSEDDWKTRVFEAKERVTGAIKRGQENFRAGNIQAQLRQLDPAQISEWVGQKLQGPGVSVYGKGITLVLCAYFLADVTSLVVGKYIPEPPPARSSSFGGIRHFKTIEDYNLIFARNLFNSKGLIPGEETGKGTPLIPGGAPVKSTLPFNLIGTVILQDELKSLATIEDKTASMVYPVRISDEIPSKARILTIEPRRVIFLNLGNSQKEFIDLPEEANANPKITLTSGRGGPPIERTSATTFNIAHAEVDKALGDLNNILTQARAVPAFENGLPAGYKLLQIVPGSIYDKLGLQNDDVIAGLDGQPLTDVGKAFEMLKNLPNTPHLELQVKRGGKAVTFAYDIR